MVHSDLRRLIKEVLTPVNLYSPEAEELLILTAATESLGGHYLYQIKGPARGIFQMEPATENDILVNYVRYKSNLRSALKQFINFNVDGTYTYRIDNPLVTSLSYQILMARIHYLRDKFSIPEAEDVDALASYWKRVYNTYKGKGVPEKAVNKYLEYIG
jgi:hypothetical protein